MRQADVSGQAGGPCGRAENLLKDASHARVLKDSYWPRFFIAITFIKTGEGLAAYRANR
jgi:hypothetical protein